ncbi:MAG TPA: saccharopine dehydrogenase C-terminal domain-containing protein [Luteibaculaceae bacterium]|nr:saccharopine dehydrogenase C-terminal domain-containing protein [Luteibaculaceae bacterium]
MKRILVIGAGRSASSLIKYLLENAPQFDWWVTVGDMDLTLAQSKVMGFERGRAVMFNGLDENARLPYLQEADLVISMLPASFHAPIVKACIQMKKSVITPSYLSDEIKAMHLEAVQQGVLVLNELGVDPGIDHMSAMEIIDRLKESGAEITGFESFTGGLVAPESDNNPWNYKFTWNPRNVVLAGQGGAVKFIQEGTYKYIPYHKVFRRTEIITIPEYGRFEGYANRDSLKYRSIYGLEAIRTLYRGTLRRVGFCKAWDLFVQLGVTDDSYVMENTETMTHRQFFNSFLAYSPKDSVETKLKYYLNIHQDDGDLMEKLEYLGVFDNTPIGIKNATPAQILQRILEKKWSLEPNDKDMTVMFHKFNYQLGGDQRELHAHMVVMGEDQTYTSMAKTVGLPLGIAAKHMLQGTFSATGVQLPIQKEIYQPILSELAHHGISFQERLFT